MNGKSVVTGLAGLAVGMGGMRAIPQNVNLESYGQVVETWDAAKMQQEMRDLRTRLNSVRQELRLAATENSALVAAVDNCTEELTACKDKAQPSETSHEGEAMEENLKIRNNATDPIE